MLNFGTSDAHSNRVTWPDDDVLDGVDWYVFGTFYEMLTAAASGRYFFGKGNSTSSAGYWPGGINTGEQYRVRHYQGGAGTTNNFSTVLFAVDSTVYSVMIYWNGTVLRLYKNGVLFEPNDSFTKAVGGNANAIRLGAAAADGLGPALKLGHPMFWTGQQAASPFTESQVDAMAALYNLGQAIPQPNHLKLWVKGTTAGTIINEITQEVGTKSGTVTFTADAVDAYFQGETFVPMYRDIASREIRRNRFAGLVHEAPLGPEVAGWEIGDPINYAHYGIPRAASLIGDRENDGMVKSGQPVYCFLTGVRFNPATRAHIAILEEAEHLMATFWSTFKLPGAINTDQDGLAQIDTGTSKTFNRSTPAWLQESGNELATVGSGYEKMNHQGFWAEDARKNLLLNSNFGDTSITTVWTDQTGDGTGSAEADDLLFVDRVKYPRALLIVKGTGVSYWQQTSVAVLTADGKHRVQIWHRETRDVGDICSWRLQRSSDSWYWNDATPAWQSGSVWNDLANNPDWGVDYSEPIDVPGNTNFTLHIGIQTGSTGDETLIGQADIQNTHFALSPLVTDSAGAFTSVADALKFSVAADATRQVVYAGRNTFRMVFEANQNAGDLEDDEVLTCFYAQFGSTVANYLAGYYEKPSGGNARFVFEMQRSSSVDAQAIFEIDIVRGTVYEVEFRLTDNSGDELGLRARTLSVLVDGVRGTDAQASGDLSTAEAQTELWWGHADSSLGWLRCNNIIADADVQQRAVPDEEALAVR
ncbi:MAG: hypothetical protein V3U85_10245 [Hyphomicrobium sp.]